MSRDHAPLIDRAARLLGDYVATGRTRKDILKDVAEALVELRATYSLEDGRRDLGGRSPAYREAVSEIYSRAHVPRDKYDTVQAALRYHVGNLLRERFDADELAAVGLKSTSPKARLARTRDVVAAMSKSGSVAELTSDPARLLVYAEALVEHVDHERLAALAGPERLAARRALAGLRACVETLTPLVAGKAPTRRSGV